MGIGAFTGIVTCGGFRVNVAQYRNTCFEHILTVLSSYYIVGEFDFLDFCGLIVDLWGIVVL